MRLWLVLRNPPGGPISPPTACPRDGCEGRRFRLHQAVAKPLRLPKVAAGNVPVHRYRCLACGRTFRVYPSGVDRGATPTAIRRFAAALHLLGLPIRDISRALAVLGAPLGKSQVHVAVRSIVRGLRLRGSAPLLRAVDVAPIATASPADPPPAWIEIAGRRLPLRGTVDWAGRPALVIEGIDGRVTTDLGASDRAFAVALQPNGRIIVAGVSNVNGDDDFALARYTAAGAPDPGFDGDGRLTTDFGVLDAAYGLAVQLDGKLVAAGYTGPMSTANDFAVARYRPDGSPDPAFSTDGRTTVDFGGDDRAFDIAIQIDGRIIAGGVADDGSGDADFALARFAPGGTLDPSFNTAGRLTTPFGGSDFAQGLALQSDGRLVLAGMTDAGGHDDFAAARYIGAIDDTPTAAQIVDFQATATNTGTVRVTWETATEAGVLGFNIYRALSPEGPWLPVNADLVPARGGAATGARYALGDAPGSGAFYYLLEAINQDGSRQAHGPVVVEVRAGRIFLPILARSSMMH